MTYSHYYHPTASIVTLRRHAGDKVERLYLYGLDAQTTRATLENAILRDSSGFSNEYNQVMTDHFKCIDN